LLNSTMPENSMNADNDSTIVLLIQSFMLNLLFVTHWRATIVFTLSNLYINPTNNNVVVTILIYLKVIVELSPS